MKIAVVTGANRGLGREVVRQLAERDYRVVLTSRTEAGAEVAGAMRAGGLAVEYFPLDVAEPDSIAALRDHLDRTYGQLEVLVNNAGIHYDTYQSTLNADFRIVEEALRVNTLGPWRVSSALYGLLARSGAGCIVNVSSASGSFVESWPGTPAYAVSKAGLNMLTVKLATGLRRGRRTRQRGVPGVGPHPYGGAGGAAERTGRSCGYRVGRHPGGRWADGWVLS